jgi:hypothetical protein
MFVIEKNIPMTIGKKLYPFDLMEVGDSFFVPGTTPKAMTYPLAAYQKRNASTKFTTRSVDGGVRLWRVV